MKTLKIEIPKGYQIDEERSTSSHIVFKAIERNWIDLGLPSGTLWCEINETGYYTYKEAKKNFSKSLPNIIDFAELVHYCSWKWDNEKEGMVVTGPNSNSIFFPAPGCRISWGNWNVLNGYYWSITPFQDEYAYNLHFTSEIINPTSHCTLRTGCSVRLVKRK